MISCNSCGRVNDESSRICRFCGQALENRQAGSQARDYAPPVTGWTGDVSAAQPVAAYSPPGVAGSYRCPHCGSNYPPIAQKRISVEGWIVFCALLVFCLPLFWIGLLMKEELRTCPVCHARLA